MENTHNFATEIIEQFESKRRRQDFRLRTQEIAAALNDIDVLFGRLKKALKRRDGVVFCRTANVFLEAGYYFVLTRSCGGSVFVRDSMRTSRSSSSWVGRTGTGVFFPLREFKEISIIRVVK